MDHPHRQTKMLTGTLNATRHAQKPLPQPNYNFSSVPKAQPDLAQSEIHKITQREHFQECMGEMLLLCKEAMRRRRQIAHHKHLHHACSKPLSLDYLADRFDIDDPCFGYMIRSTEEKSKGMLQGFITATTFTNWQTSFRWDSLHPAAYECDSDELIESIAERKRDEDGSLTKQLQSTVHAGNIHQEGIVWPRICEISLLGGLGCGKVLIDLIIEELEHLKATNRANYDYVVLQATDNSISFYETMGFVRIGAIMLDETMATDAATTENDQDAASPASVQTDDLNFFVTSPVTTYTVKTGQSVAKIAQRFGVDVYDLLFLNRHILGDARPCDRPFLGTVLTIPVAKESATSSDTPPSPTLNPEEIQWHVAKENETPRIIAKIYNVNALDVVNANKVRLPGLISSSRLKEGTKIKVSHLHIIEKDYKAYAHWSFPDSRFEDPEPSYMMVRKLNRRKQNQRNEYPVVHSLKAPILQNYVRPPLLLPPKPSPRATTTRPSKNNRQPSIAPPSKKPVHPDAPIPPKRPPSAFFLYLAEQRKREIPEIAGRNVTEATQILSQLWKELSPQQKGIYEDEAKISWEKYSQEKHHYQSQLKEFRKKHPDVDFTTAATTTTTTPFLKRDSNLTEAASMPLSVDEIPDIQHNLYNAVVRLKDGAMTEGSNYKYWYVLTFIPDLKWCHLAPMVQCGTFGPDKPRAKGRPKWKLVSETLGMEVDISSTFCIPIKSRSMRKTVDADKEEWDIIDDGTDPSHVPPAIHPRLLSGGGRTSVFGSVDGRCSTAVKPSAERVRNKQRSSTCSLGDASISKTELPLLKAAIPGQAKPIVVRLSGNETFNPNEFNVNSIKKRGRPVVSKIGRSPGPLSDSKQNISCTSSATKSEIPEGTVAPSNIRMRKSPRPKAFAQSLRPSPGGILRRKAMLAAMDAEKNAVSPAPRSTKRKATDISIDEEEDSEDTSYCTSDSTATDDSSKSVASMDSDVPSINAVVTRISPRRPSRLTPVPVEISREADNRGSLRNTATTSDPDESDPLFALNKNDLSYVLDQGFKTAEQFLKATNAEIAENMDQWREKNGMSKLKSGPLAQASRWKYTVRKRAQELGRHELVDLGRIPCTSSGSDESRPSKKLKVEHPESCEEKFASGINQSTETKNTRISPRRLSLSSSISGANAFKNIPKTGIDFLSSENIQSATDFLSFSSNELGKRLEKWRLANGLGKCKSCVDMINKWKSSVRKEAEKLVLSESVTVSFSNNESIDQPVAGRTSSHSSSARSKNANSDVDPINILHPADLKYLASEGIHSAAEFLSTPQPVIRANLNRWREKEGLNILKSVPSSVSKWRSMVRQRAQELGMDNLLEMEYRGASGNSDSISQYLRKTSPKVEILRRPSIAKKRKF
jgi:hypothetical protein